MWRTKSLRQIHYWKKEIEEVEMYPSCRNVEVGMEVMDQF